MSPSSSAGAHPRVAYRGPSTIDGAPIRVIVYSLDHGSENRKLGPMVQVMFAPDGEPPNEAISSGADRSVCGDCTHRPGNAATCYVVLNFGIIVPWHVTSEDAADLDAACAAVSSTDLPLRLGAWGDPAAAPFEVVEQLARAAGGRVTGYTQQWRTCDPRMRQFLMASVSTEAERREAKALGWRTYRVRASGEALLPGEMICPASAEAEKKTTCSRCLACDGGDLGRDVVIVAHGDARKVERFNQQHRHGAELVPLRHGTSP